MTPAFTSPAADALWTEVSPSVDRVIDTHCRDRFTRTAWKCRAWHGAGVGIGPHVRPRRGRCGVERRYSREYVPGYRKVPGVMNARRYRVLEGTSLVTAWLRVARRPCPKARSGRSRHTLLAQFAAHAAGHDACTGFFRVYVRVNPKSRGCARCPFCKSRASCLGAACAFHQKGTVSRGEQVTPNGARAGQRNGPDRT